MPLRANNEAITTDMVLAALAQVMFHDANGNPNTALALASGTVAVNDDSAFLLDTATWPGCLLEEGAQDTARVAPRTWQKKLTIYAFYMARWDQDPRTNDAVWSGVNADMERVIANLTDNPTLTCQLSGEASATRHALSLATLAPSPRTQKAIDRETYAVPVVQRLLTVTVNLPPYISVG